MTNATKSFGSFDLLGQILSCLPEVLYPRLAWLLARHHPYQLAASVWTANCGTALGLPTSVAQEASRRNLGRHGLGFLRHRRYARISDMWVKSNVRFIGSLPPPGSLLLTYHTPEFHLLCSLIGMAGLRVYPVVQPESASNFGKAVIPYLRRLHRGTAKHFCGGEYVFITPGIPVRRRISELLRAGSVVVVLNDNHCGGEGSLPVSFMGRLIAPRYGAIEVALASGVPVWVGLLAFDFHEQEYRMEIRALSGHSPAAVLTDYFDFLAQHVCRAPDCWDGWQWLPV